MAKPALGRGLGALLGGVAGAPKPLSQPPSGPEPGVNELANPERVEHVALNRIRPCPFQPRKEFTAEALQELADSIREQGIVQPLIVRKQGDAYELIAGERRWRAAQMLGLAEAPVLVRAVEDREALELALIENLQRENLNPLEEAQGYAQLIAQFDLKQDEVAVKVGKSRVTIANALRLLKLPESVQEQIRSGRLSVGHAKVILGLNTAEEQTLAAERVVRDALNVRQTEQLVAQWQRRSQISVGTASGSIQKPGPPDAHLADLQARLQQRLGTRVALKYRQGKGAIEIRFFNDDDLERILDILGISVE